MARIDRALAEVDGAIAARARPALDWMRARSGKADPDLESLRGFLRRDLPSRWPSAGRDRHEVAWALGDLFEHAGLPRHAALCREPVTHETLAVWRWTESFPDVPREFWTAAPSALGPGPVAPARAGLSLASARALLEAVGDGLDLTEAGHLPVATVFALDDRFRWTEEFPWLRPSGEPDIPPLRFLHEHLMAQRLLIRDGRRLRLSEPARSALGDTGRLWRLVVDPAPRWAREFDRDALGVMAAVLLREGRFVPGRMTEEVTPVLAAKWRPAADGSVYDGASPVVQAWYQLGVPLGWWDTGRGPADRHPNGFGRAAAAAVLRSVARPEDVGRRG